MEYLFAAALFILYCLVNLACYYLRRRAEHSSGWKVHLEDTPPRQAGRRKVG